MNKGAGYRAVSRFTGRRTKKPRPIFTGPAESARTGVQDEKASGSLFCRRLICF